jgi:hypothetical protein
MKLGKCKPGDVVLSISGQVMVVYAEVAGRVQIRHVEWTLGQAKTISGPFLLDPGMEVTVLARGVERFPKGTSKGFDPVGGGAA